MADVTVQLGIPVTTPARTLLDLSDGVSQRILERAVNEARLRRRVSLPELAALLERSPGRGTRWLRDLVEQASAPTRSHFEDSFLAFVTRHGLPAPEVNQRVRGYEVDMLWRKERLIVELDGYAFHASAAAFERDRRRDADLQSAGYRVVRITWRRLADEPQLEARRLLRLLS